MAEGAALAAGVQIRVASLISRPRDIPPEWAEDAYRAGEALALGLDIALAAAGLKRTQLIAQRANRVAFAETWTPPHGWADFETLVRDMDAGAGRFPHLLDHAHAPWYYVPREFSQPLMLPEPQPQSHAGDLPRRTLSVGSVSALARELEALEPLLIAAGHDPEQYFPAPLLEATAISLETGLVITLEPAPAATPT
ncbi:MAG TPA: hypothetical protein VM536_04920 [Chloroflexia bacterium]|nr:hypothetical protein [Chloroflexia bacterium]